MRTKRFPTVAVVAALVCSSVVAAAVLARVDPQHPQVLAPAADRFGTVYVGLPAVPDPAPRLGALAGPWHELGGGPSSVSVAISGRPSKHFELGLVAVARQESRLEVLTSNGQRAIAAVPSRGPTPLELGPLAAPASRRVSVALYSISFDSAERGSPLTISPVQARYLAPGEAVLRMRALAQPGPDGLRGIPLPAGTQGGLRITTGVRGASAVHIRAAARRGPVRIAITMAGVTHASVMSPGQRTVVVGPYPRTATGLLLHVTTAGAQRGASLLLAGMKVVQLRRSRGVRIP